MTSPAVLLPLDVDLVALTNEVRGLDHGQPGRLYPDPTAGGHYADTDLLAELPAVVATLELFQCDLLAARLLRLGPNSQIREHTDLDLSIDDGEAWYLDLNLPHSVENRGLTARIHLVVDCVVNDWLRQLIEHGANSRRSGP